MTIAGSSPRPAAGADSKPPDLRRTLTSIGLIVYSWDLRSDDIAWGANGAELLGWPGVASGSTGADFARMVEPADGMTRPDALASASERDGGSGVPYAASYGLRLGSGELVMVDDTGRWFANAHGQPIHAHGTMRLRRPDRDQTDATQARAAFLAQIGQDVGEAIAAGRPLSVFAIAVSNLSELNDDLGFEAADRVIGTVLGRLCGTMRGRDRFARYSGNRFALALRGCGQAEAEVAAERLCGFVTAEPVGTAAGPKAVRLVIGGATAPDHALDAPTLLRRAELSLGLAKRRAGAPFLMYDPRLFRAKPRGDRREPLLESIEMLNARRVAMACQPVVAAADRSVAFHEALLRVEGRDGRIRPAGDVVPALERAGLVHLADSRMLELVIEHLADVPSARLALNVSPATLDRADWLSTLSGHLRSTSGISCRLILEVTETAAIRDPEATRRVLEAAKALGVCVAIDDFGAGHTSFRHLRDFPLDFIKIDGAFIQNLSRSPEDGFFVRTLIDLARHLGIATVAEWVEDEASAELLVAWGADYLQGDHCGPPELLRPRAPQPASLVA